MPSYKPKRTVRLTKENEEWVSAICITQGTPVNWMINHAIDRLREEGRFVTGQAVPAGDLDRSANADSN